MRRPKVLVVEDNAATRSLLQETLEIEGFEVTTVGDGLRALASINANIPSVVVLDLMMPGMDGFSVLKQIRTQPETAELPVLILSALDDNDSTWRGWSTGCHYYMTKPFEVEDLVGAVKRLAGVIAA